MYLSVHHLCFYSFLMGKEAKFIVRWTDVTVGSLYLFINDHISSSMTVFFHPWLYLFIHDRFLHPLLYIFIHDHIYLSMTEFFMTVFSLAWLYLFIHDSSSSSMTMFLHQWPYMFSHDRIFHLNNISSSITITVQWCTCNQLDSVWIWIITF